MRPRNGRPRLRLVLHPEAPPATLARVQIEAQRLAGWRGRGPWPVIIAVVAGGDVSGGALAALVSARRSGALVRVIDENGDVLPAEVVPYLAEPAAARFARLRES